MTDSSTASGPLRGEARRRDVEALLGARTAEWTDRERAAISSMIGALDPSVRHLNDILDWLDDIAARDGCPPAAALDDAELTSLVRAAGPASERLKRWKDRLRRMRFPRLAAREDAIASAIGDLGLGRSVTVAAPRDLEGGIVTVTIQACSSTELRDAVKRLHGAVERGAFDRVFVLIGEV